MTGYCETCCGPTDTGGNCQRCGPVVHVYAHAEVGPVVEAAVNVKVDGLVSNCARCGDGVPLDYRVKDEVWRQVPDYFRLGVLCTPCLDRVLPKGLDPADVEVAYLTTSRGTLPLVPYHQGGGR